MATAIALVGLWLAGGPAVAAPPGDEPLHVVRLGETLQASALRALGLTAVIGLLATRLKLAEALRGK